MAWVQKVVTDQFTVSKYTDVVGNSNHVILINGPFGNPKSANNAITALLTAKENDTVKIIVNSIGGNVLTLEMFSAAMATCKAKVTVRAAGLAASCGGFILFEGNTTEIGKASKIVFHNMSVGVNTNAGFVKDWLTVFEDKLEYYAAKVRKNGAINEQELEAMVANKLDMYFTYNDMKARGIA